VTILALVAVTIVMTVLTIMEPLRKQGLATAQVAELFLYTLPVMLSLTLPFAALFATTIVYGRFAQDQELLACRASGISTLTVLKPAVVLGILVTLVSLALTNFVAPEMAKRGQLAVVKNIKRIAYHKIKKESYAEFGKKGLVHASRVNEEQDALVGVVFGERENKLDAQTGKVMSFIRVWVASTAALKTASMDVQDPYEPDAEPITKYYASVFVTDPVGPLSNSIGSQGLAEEVPLESFELDDPTKDEPDFYNWRKLIATYKDPSIHGEIRQKVEEYRREIHANRVLGQIAEAIRTTHEYKGLRGPDGERLRILAWEIDVAGREAELRGQPLGGNSVAPVVVEIYRPGREGESFAAESGRLVAQYDDLQRRTFLSLELRGKVHKPDAAGDVILDSWDRGEIPLPADPVMETATISELYHQPEMFTQDKQILNEIKRLKEDRPKKIRGEIKAEMHSRIAFGLSCMLLVAAGAGLGLVCKGGQMITAMAISAIPGSIVLVVVMMGKKMISNPKSSDMAGVLMIWGAILGMLVFDMVLYHRLGRR
jgi:lipopolysaccharide export LptBFGC system permease protein LptF